MLLKSIAHRFTTGLALALAGVLSAAEGPGVAQGSIRCGRDLVSVGAQAFILLDKCGEPDFRQLVGISQSTDLVRAGEAQVVVAADRVELVTEEWVYRLGKGRLARILTITGGVVTDIRLSQRQ